MHGLGWLGVISYSLYLTHVFLGLKIVNLGIRLIKPDSPYIWVVQPSAWVLSIILAWVFYKNVEKPLEIMRKKISKNLFKKNKNNINSNFLAAVKKILQLQKK